MSLALELIIPDVDHGPQVISKPSIRQPLYFAPFVLVGQVTRPPAIELVEPSREVLERPSTASVPDVANATGPDARIAHF